MGDFSGPPVLSPDGTQLAFAAHTGKERDTIWVRDLNNTTARKLVGTEGVYEPFWSADGRYLGFFSDGKLKKIPAAGGPTTVLADAANARGGAWNRDNIILFTPDYREAIWRLSASGSG
jgi:Tol biopolymer transport system component